MEETCFKKIGKPKKFTLSFKIKAYLILLSPGLLVIIIDIILCYLPSPALLSGIMQILVLSYLIIALLSLFGTCIIWIVFLPLFSGSGFIESWFSAKKESLETDTIPAFIIDYQQKPRWIKGFEGFLDDADDVGVFSILDQEIHFEGEQFSVTIPRHKLKGLTCRINFRTLGIVGPDCHLSFQAPIDGRQGIMIHIREGLTIPQVRRLNKKLRAALEAFFSESEAEAT